MMRRLRKPKWASEELFMQDLRDCVDAREGDSNDAEIDALWNALEHACALLGVTIPEGKD